MKYEPAIKTRRQFLQHSLVGGALTWTVPAFMQSSMQALHAESDQARSGKDGPVLVVMQLAGGNDGLNTIVPYTNDAYYKARPRLAVKKSDCIKIDDDFGMHPSLAGLKGSYDDGHLAILHGVGYPNPNRSHFRSTEIWHTASDADAFESHGWIGRYFDHACSGCDASVAVAVGRQAPQAFASANPTGVTFQDPNGYKFIRGKQGRMADIEADEDFLMEMNGLDDAAGGSISSINGSAKPSVSPLDFLERVALDAKVSSDQINEVVKRTKNQVEYPRTKVGNELALIGKMIAGGMPTRIYYLNHGGFDTHANQLASHGNLLEQYADAQQAFLRDLKAQGNLDRVVLLTFSEFGRRVKENGSGGTDHGAASQVFISGGRVKKGLLGTHPSLAPKDLNKGDPTFNVDFRSVYATLIEKHLGASSEAALKKAFPTLDLLV